MHAHRPRLDWLRYFVIYVVSFLICWGSLALLIWNGGKYVSILSWTLFGIEEFCRNVFGSAGSVLISAATIIPAAFGAIAFPLAEWLRRSTESRRVRIAIRVALLFATLLWVPNPWQDM